MHQWRTLFIMVLEVLLVSAHGRKCDEIRSSIRKEVSVVHENHEELMAEIDGLKKSMQNLVQVVQANVPVDCSQAHRQGSWSTITTIAPPNMTPRSVQCDQLTDGGGWTVIVSRSVEAYPAYGLDALDRYAPLRVHVLRFMRFEDQPGIMIDFNRTWNEYKQGFGSVDTEYWIGNDVIHSLTKDASWEAMVIIDGWNGDHAIGQWDSFRLLGEEDKYKLVIGGYRKNVSTLQDGLTYHSDRPFSTFDADNDSHREHCAQKYGGGWWFNQCHVSHLTGTHLFPGTSGEHAVHWLPWNKNKESLRSAKMMIRPKWK